MVVIDSSLGDVGGTHLVHLVRQLRPDMGIILTFAQSDPVQEREARQAGVLYYGDREGVKEIAQVLQKGLSCSSTAKATPPENLEGSAEKRRAPAD